MRFPAHALAAALALSASFAHAAGPTGRLNDTGQTSCYDGADAAVACSASGVGSDAGANPRQDARFGRDAAQAGGQLPAKIGGGAAGFDFTKVCMNGDLAGTGTCPANPSVGTGATQWACTKDNVTNLIWSIESVGSKTWAQATDTAGGSLIDGYITGHRCGFDSGWRVPTSFELQSIVHFGDVSMPTIDTGYFPSTAAHYFWSNDVDASNPANSAWIVSYMDGRTTMHFKTNTGYVRLVRSGQ